jgi:hypothetical protein
MGIQSRLVVFTPAERRKPADERRRKDQDLNIDLDSLNRKNPVRSENWTGLLAVSD